MWSVFCNVNSTGDFKNFVQFSIFQPKMSKSEQNSSVILKARIKHILEIPGAKVILRLFNKLLTPRYSESKKFDGESAKTTLIYFINGLMKG